MKDLYNELENLGVSILLYGMGDGADKLLSVLENKGIPVSGVFCSDGFERGKTFRGMPVVSYTQAKKDFGDFAVLLAFGSAREETLRQIDLVAGERFLRIPDLPVAGNVLFDGAFWEAHREDFARARALFQDEASKELFDAVVMGKLTGRPEFFKIGLTEAEEDLRFPLHAVRYRHAVDLGAYDGDSARFLLAHCPSLEKVTAFEPDEKTYLRLKKNTAGLPVEALPFAAWDREERLTFSRGGNRGSGVGAPGKDKKEATVRAIPGDAVFRFERVDFIKFDVEGAEKRALAGLSRTIARDKPEMLVSCYHRPEDLFELPLGIAGRYPFYRLYLRRKKGVPMWETAVYCTI